MSNEQAERAVELLEWGPRFRSSQLQRAEIRGTRGGGRDASSLLHCFPAQERKKARKKNKLN